MKQYNRIMLGEHGKYLDECLAQDFIGANFLPETDLANTPYNDEVMWRKQMVATYLQENPDKSIGTARNSIGFLWTICFGLKKDDIVIASNGQGGYHVGIIDGDYIYVPGGNLPHRRSVVWLNTVISRKSMSQKLQYSTGSIGTCCNITKYAEELETLIGGKTVTNTAVADKHSNTFKERSLHKLLAHYLIEKNRFPKTIFTKHPARQTRHKNGFIPTWWQSSSTSFNHLRRKRFSKRQTRKLTWICSHTNSNAESKTTIS